MAPDTGCPSAEITFVPYSRFRGAIQAALWALGRDLVAFGRFPHSGGRPTVEVELTLAGGAMILPETAAQSLLVTDGRVVGVRTGDKGRGATLRPHVDLVFRILEILHFDHAGGAFLFQDSELAVQQVSELIALCWKTGELADMSQLIAAAVPRA